LDNIELDNIFERDFADIILAKIDRVGVKRWLFFAA